MSDVLDNEPGPTPLWAVPVAMLAVVAVVVALAWRSGNSPGAAPAASPTASPSPSPAPPPAPLSASNACGGDVELPIIEAEPLPDDSHLRILVGDRDLRVVDVDAGKTSVLATRNDRRSFTDMVQTADQVLAVLRDPCSVDGFGNGLVAVLDPSTGELGHLGSGDAVLPGQPPTVVDFDPVGTTMVRTLEKAERTRVPTGWELHARTTNGYFTSVSGSGDAAPEVGVGSVETGRLTTTFGSGPVVAASAELLFWLAGDCPDVHCVLTWTTPAGTNTGQPIDTYAWGGVVSPDGSKLAFRKERATGLFGDGPPNDVAVLDTGSGQPASVLPGLVLPAKAGLTMTWSPDSTWLVMGADLGTGPLVLIWREGMRRVAMVPVPPTGGGTTGPPALLVLSR